MQLFLDPWNPDFSGSLQADSPEEDTPPEVRLDIELREWKTILPPYDPNVNFVFVDGVRRIDARVILQNGQIQYGLLGSVAAGGVAAGRKQQNAALDVLSNAVIKRYFITGGGFSFDRTIDLPHGFSYEAVSVADAKPQAPLQKLQQLMRDAEGKVISQFSLGDSDALLVADGPLHFPWARESKAVGYIKSFHQWYLPSSHIPMLSTLRPGERTPLFLIHGQGAQFPDRYGWFVRLAAPEAGDSPLSGLARLEIACDTGLDHAIRSANRSTRLSEFVSKKYRDPRSPQNLVPIGALEKTLKHLLGDIGIMRRWISAWIRTEQA